LGIFLVFVGINVRLGKNREGFGELGYFKLSKGNSQIKNAPYHLKYYGAFL
jgi:hypothetical protein